MKIYLARHGETEYNAKDIICGVTDLSLTEEGFRQARALAEDCAAHGDIQRIIVSPMLRARQTAGVVAERLGLPIQIEERLREWDYGSFEGKKRGTPGFDEAKAAWGCRMPGGGESVFQLVQRVYNVLDDVRERYAAENVLLVCHNGICRVADSYFSDMTVEDFMAFFTDNGKARVYEIEGSTH